MHHYILKHLKSIEKCILKFKENLRYVLVNWKSVLCTLKKIKIIIC